MPYQSFKQKLNNVILAKQKRLELLKDLHSSSSQELEFQYSCNKFDSLRRFTPRIATIGSKTMTIFVYNNKTKIIIHNLAFTVLVFTFIIIP